MINFTMWDHQEAGMKRALEHNCFAFLMDPGTGKSLTTIQVLRYVYARHGQVLPTVILAPLITLKNWADEFEKFSRIPKEHVTPLLGSGKKRVQTIQKAVARNGDKNIFVINYEALVGASGLYEALMDFCPLVLVLDESQRIKNHKSKRTKKVLKMADSAMYKYLLTGTPILNSPMDIFSQWLAMDGGETFGKNFFTFRGNYFYDKNYRMPAQCHFPDWTIKPHAEENLTLEMNKYCIRAKKEECLDLPPLLKRLVKVELPKKVMAAYNDMKDHFVTSLDGNVMTADVAITKTLRMLQLVNGFMKDDDGAETEVESPKLAALEDILEEICPANKVLIWACFKNNYAAIKKVCEKLKLSYVEAHGAISSAKKFAAVDAFNNEPSVSVFIGHPGSLGIGINLVPASYSIYFSRTWNLEHDLQSQARNYRGGSEVHKKITRIDIVAEGTIDEAVVDALDGKVASAEKIIDGLRKTLTA